MNHLAADRVRIAALEAIIRRKDTRIIAQGQEEARLHEQCKRLTEHLARQRETCDRQREYIHELECENAHLQKQLAEVPS